MVGSFSIMKTLLLILSIVLCCQSADNIYTIATKIQTMYVGSIVRPNAIQPISVSNIPTIFLIPIDSSFNGKDTGAAFIKMWRLKYTVKGETLYLTIYSVDTLCFIAGPEAMTYLNKGYNIKLSKLTTANVSTLSK